MLQVQTWKVVAVLLVGFIGAIVVAPNAFASTWLSATQRSATAQQQEPLAQGLDLQGGSRILFEADTEVAVKQRAQTLLEDLRRGFRKLKVLYYGLAVTTTGVTVRISDLARIEDARTVLHAIAMPATDVNVRIDPDGSANVTITDFGREQIRANAMAHTVEVLRKRLDPEGTKGVTIQLQGASQIIVQVSGEQNLQAAIRLGQITAKLAFHMVDESVTMADVEADRIPPGSSVMPETRGRGSRAQTIPIVIKERAIITGDMLERAQGSLDSFSRLPVIALKFNAQGTRRLADITRNSVGKRFAAVLDGKVITAPVIRTPILGGQCLIQGDFTIEEATEIAALLNAGALPVPLRVGEAEQVR
jgi:preprotein translocase subunit SecD